jgi:hypothetical protein
MIIQTSGGEKYNLKREDTGWCSRGAAGWSCQGEHRAILLSSNAVRQLKKGEPTFSPLSTTGHSCPAISLILSPPNQLSPLCREEMSNILLLFCLSLNII